MKAIALLLLLGCAAVLPFRPATAAPTPSNQSLLGKFEYSEGRTSPKDRNIQLTVTSGSNSQYNIEFSAGHYDGEGAAPDGDGSGAIGPDGILRFTFEDSFSNKGKGTFQRSKKGFILQITIEDVQDSRCMMFYEEPFVLKRVPQNRRQRHANEDSH